MSEILGFLVMVLIFGGLLTLAAYTVQREWKLEEGLAEFARGRGWSFQRHPAGRKAYIFKSREDPVAWTLELYRSGKYQAAQTLWATDDHALSEGPVLIGSEIAHVYAGGSVDDQTRQQVARVGWELFTRTSGWGAFALPNLARIENLGLDSDRLAPRPAGSNDFQKHYSSIGPSTGLVERLLTPRLQALLLKWPSSHSLAEMPLLIAASDGLSVRLASDRPAGHPELLADLVEIGLALADALYEPPVEAAGVSEPGAAHVSK